MPYDTFGRLVRENNKKLDKTIVYSYNGIGNITSAKTYAYTTSATPTGSYTEETYTYGNSIQTDRLTNYNGTSISYNTGGCVSSYNGWTYGWSKGKLSYLKKTSSARVVPLASNTKTYSFSYNALGQRTLMRYSYVVSDSSTPLQDGELTDYTKKFDYDNAGRLIHEKNTKTLTTIGTTYTEIRYLYDESGIIGMIYGTSSSAPATYYFRRNLQGDVVAIYNTSGARVVEYAYDAYGNCTVVYAQNTALAEDNPIRYRGYYYDVDTGLYYLNARYYNPQWRRFISPDSTEYLAPETPNGLNLYAYCGNDPVNYADPSGHSWESFWDGVGDWFKEHWAEIAIGTAFIVGGAIVSALTCGAGTTAWAAFGSALLSSAIQVGAGIGTGILVNGVSNLIQGDEFLDNVGDTIASAYMLGGILSGSSQMLSGGFRFLRAKTGFKGIDSKKFGFISPDKLYYDKPGMTILRFGSRGGAKIALDFGRYGIHGHIWKWSAHIPLIPGIVGVSELF